MVALLVGGARLLELLLDVGLVDEERRLDLVDDRAEGVVRDRVEQVADVLEREAGVLGVLADAHPVDVALAHVPDALGLVEVAVDLALDDRLEVLLHLAAGALDEDPERQLAALLVALLGVLADDDDLVVLDLVHLAHVRPLEGGRALAAELDEGVLLADALALEGRAEGHRDRRLLDDDLQAAQLDRLLHDLAVVEFLLDLLVGADARRVDDRDVRVGDRREAHVDDAGAGRPDDVVEGPKHDGEGEDPVLLVEQVVLEGAGLLATEDERGADSPVGGVEDVLGVGTERHDARVPAELDATAQQLLGSIGSGRVAGVEEK